MPLSTYDASIGLLLNGLNTLNTILAKAEEHAKAKELNVDDYVPAKLYEDMFALDFQVYMAVDTATKCVARLLGTEPVEWKREETSFAALQKKTTDAIEVLKKVDPEAVEGKEANTVTMVIGAGKTKTLPGKEYITSYSVPNFFFHLQIAYAILRLKGVPVGKLDYLSSFSS
ncbi:hypothetical protein RJZ56_004391 [Blastomyces dermatitidis]|uniref:DUF1993 domain-containing protein n=3 Tax=Blastomyces TaxID=229219 RepID=A0A179UXB0_BLAGS|nr:uncharacterized protein BDBG_08039 [Blastomyces gilchristii SLH14081]XP_045271519.1 uncharacterized protein BDCG_00098 [Blastomyces dermatitidis ER-3]EGE81979.1 hypothetical protein BDDG_04922 [Blastomyces dermatitidis ATCC 18188]EQL35805.1 hypothetical protein BDFG_02427 [Blastomyces dermatitidis ATCC 26199]EEQ83293.1 hypothetical protein BDCG_00098 [Blastomyces dermatitidis ER-3]OAT12725.1 hypothetical protein BDBG_08039 [Blastomyces gilchristii SLH14081]